MHTRHLSLASHLIDVFGYVNNYLCRWLGFQEQVLAASCSLGLGTIMLGSPHLSPAPLKPEHLGGCLQLPPTRKKLNVSMWELDLDCKRDERRLSFPTSPALPIPWTKFMAFVEQEVQGEWFWILTLDPQCPLEVLHSRSPGAAPMHQPSQYQGFPPKVTRLGI